MKMKKMIWAAVLTVILQGFSAVSLEAMAAENAAVGNAAAEAGKTLQEGKKRPPRRTEMTEEEMKTVLSRKYFMTPEEAEAFLQKDVAFRELEKAALYSYVSGRNVEEILALRREEPWQRVQALIGATGQKLYDRQIEMKAENLERWWGIDREIGLHYLRKGYPMHYVKVSWILSNHTGRTMDWILQDRKYRESWKDWAKRQLGISPETYDRWIGEYKNPAYFPGKYF